MGQRKTHGDAVAGYVQMRLDQMYDEGRGTELVAIAKKAGVSKSHPSQVRSGKLGLGEKLLPNYAKLLDFKKASGEGDVDALRKSAYEWWLAKRRRSSEPLTAPMRAARDDLLQYRRAKAEEIDRILEAFGHERFRDRDVAWWLDTIISELRVERAQRDRDSSSRSVAIASSR